MWRVRAGQFTCQLRVRIVTAGSSRPTAAGGKGPLWGRLVTMKRLPISSVEIDSAGNLFVRPKTDRSYEYIYREANGLRWDGHKRALHAYEPARWEPAELLQHMATALREC
jgi:hypothetical protein